MGRGGRAQDPDDIDMLRQIFTRVALHFSSIAHISYRLLEHGIPQLITLPFSSRVVCDGERPLDRLRAQAVVVLCCRTLDQFGLIARAHTIPCDSSLPAAHTSFAFQSHQVKHLHTADPRGNTTEGCRRAPLCLSDLLVAVARRSSLAECYEQMLCLTCLPDIYHRDSRSHCSVT